MSDKLERLSASLAPRSAAPLAPTADLPAPFHPFQEQNELGGPFALRDYWRIVHLRRRTILAMGALGLLAAGIYTYVVVPTFRAAATIQIDREERSIARFDENSPQLPEQADYLETQYKVLQSRTLARRVIAGRQLQRFAELNHGLQPGMFHPDAGEEAAIHPKVVERFLQRLRVHPGKGTRLVEVSYESVNPQLAPAVVNTLAEEYIEHNLEARWNATQKASRWLQQQLASLQQALEDSETALQAYAREHAILFVEERKDITTEKLAQLEDELTRAEAGRIQKQSVAMMVRDAVESGYGLPGSLGSKTYQDFQARLAELRREQSRLLVTFAPGYPKVRRIEREIEQLQKSLEQEKSRILRSVTEAFQTAQGREQLLREAAAGQRRLVNRVSDDFIQYGLLKRDAETNRQLYDGLLQRLKEAGISAGLRASNISILDPAETPLKPYRPQKLLNYSLGLLAGLLCGVLLAFVQEHMNDSIRTPEEVERLTGMGLLAVIPRSRSKLDGRKLATAPAGAAALASLQPAENGAARGALRWEPEQDLSEAYRTLRSSVLLGWDESMRRILLTSSQPQEGKTTLSLNLVCSLAQLGRRVLLIDGDMRRPDCGRQLGVAPEKGLSEYLQGLAELDEVIVPTTVPHLSLVAAGKAHSSASDLLYSPRLAALLQEAGRRFEHVVIDSPPSLVLSDARTISRMVEGVIMVVSDKTERNSLLRTKQMFDDAGVRFLGFVMNRVSLDTLDYGYYRDYGYYYAHGEETKR